VQTVCPTYIGQPLFKNGRIVKVKCIIDMKRNLQQVRRVFENGLHRLKHENAGYYYYKRIDQKETKQ